MNVQCLTTVSADFPAAKCLDWVGTVHRAMHQRLHDRLVGRFAVCYDPVMLNPTPPEAWCDAQGRPYFLWDCDVTLARLHTLLRDDDRGVRAYWLAKAMRQAKPDDVLQLVSPGDILRDWDAVEPLLGSERAFWTWLVARWRTRSAG